MRTRQYSRVEPLQPAITCWIHLYHLWSILIRRSNTYLVEICSCTFYPWERGHLWYVIPATASCWLIDRCILGKSFGVGVILATAFVHMLVPSFEKLSSPCLGYVWNEVYPAFGGLFAMFAILIMQLIEYFASNELEHHFKNLEALHPHHSPLPPLPPPTTASSFNNRPAAAAVVCDHQSIDQATIVDGYLSQSHSNNNTLHPPPHPSAPRLPPPPPPPSTCSTTTIQNQRRDKRYHPFNTCPAHSHFSNQSDELKDKKRYLNTIVLEFGILAHSVIIGITLGVSPQSEFVTLLVAICFHQFFEGSLVAVVGRKTHWANRYI